MTGTATSQSRLNMTSSVSSCPECQLRLSPTASQDAWARLRRRLVDRAAGGAQLGAGGVSAEEGAVLRAHVQLKLFGAEELDTRFIAITPPEAALWRYFFDSIIESKIVGHHLCRRNYE